MTEKPEALELPAWARAVGCDMAGPPFTVYAMTENRLNEPLAEFASLAEAERAYCALRKQLRQRQ